MLYEYPLLYIISINIIEIIILREFAFRDVQVITLSFFIIKRPDQQLLFEVGSHTYRLELSYKTTLWPRTISSKPHVTMQEVNPHVCGVPGYVWRLRDPEAKLWQVLVARAAGGHSR